MVSQSPMEKNHQDSQISIISLNNGDANIPGNKSTAALVKFDETEPVDQKKLRSLKIRGWKNALALSFGWLFLYAGFMPIAALQNSLNGDDGMGPVSLGVQNAMEMIGNLFLSNLIINKIGNKWTVAIGSFLFSAFIAANFYPTWGTLVPTAALAGLGASMTWIAQNTYMTKLSQYYSGHTGLDFNSVNIRFFGTFYSIYYSCNVVGNIASSFLLGADFQSENETFAYDPMSLCGADYCNEDLGTSFHPEGLDEDMQNVTLLATSQRPETIKVYALVGFCLGLALLSTLLMTLLVDGLPSLGVSEDLDSSKSSLHHLLATFKHLKDPNQVLLMPLTFYNGLDNEFIYNEFTKAFVTCHLGFEYIGFVTACYGIFGPISSLVSGWLSSKRTRFVPFLVSGTAHISVQVAMIYWNPVPGTAITVYIMASVWGIGSGVWCSQLNALYGIIFADNLEAAFANFHLWNSVASTVLYATSHKICTIYKIYFMLTIVSVGLVGYFIVMLRTHLSSKQGKDANGKPITLTYISNLGWE